MPKSLTLKQWRLVKELSRKELSKRSGIAESSIYNYEKDIENLKNAKYETVIKICDALEISIDDIFLEATSENPK